MKKRIIGGMLASMLILTTALPVYASNNVKTFTKLPDINNETLINENYDVHTIEFPKIKTNNFSTLSNSSIKLRNIDNIDRAKNMISSLNLTSKGFTGLEEACLNELDNISDKETYLENYSVYLPKSDVYYGTYDGYKFRASFSVYNESYQRTITGKSNHQRWASGALNLAMNFAPQIISIPFSLLTSAADDVKFYDGAWTDVTTSDEVTSRYIWIQDLDKKMSANTNSYVIVINDMSRITRPVVVSYPNSPYADPKLDATLPRKEISSPNFYNSNRNMDRGLRYYIGGDLTNYIKDHVSKGKLQWR